MVPQLVYGEDATAHHLRLGGEKGREDETGTITQHQVLTHIQSLQEQNETQSPQTWPQAILDDLKVLSSPRSSRDGNFLALEKRIDGGALANIRIAYLHVDWN